MKRSGVLLSAFLWATGTHASEVKEHLSFRWRYETFDTLSNNPELDSEYGFSNLRVRFGAETKWNRFLLRGTVQAASALSLPEAASFGPGRLYFVSSGGEDTSPGQLNLAELQVSFKIRDTWSVRVGRQGLTDGQEVLTSDARFDWLKQTRLSERLVGTWDWVNVGRRFDGAAVSYNRPRWNVSGFGARVLQGGIDYDDAFEHLDGVDVGGVVFTAKRSTWFRQSEIRLFDVLYRDDRPSTRASLGEGLFVQAIGGSFIGIYGFGPGSADLFVWLALETGNYGRRDHAASAFIAEWGYGWPRVKTAPWIRLGIATAGGDEDPTDGEHGTFFNMVPTNHKYYGYQDLVAFQNLTNAYFQIRWEPVAAVRLLVEGHVFRLRSADDPWYSGSGAANNGGFGYEARGALSERPLPKRIGSELDVVVTWIPRPTVAFDVGYSHFRRGDLARRLYPFESGSSWLYFTTTFSH